MEKEMYETSVWKTPLPSLGRDEKPDMQKKHEFVGERESMYGKRKQEVCMWQKPGKGLSQRDRDKVESRESTKA